MSPLRLITALALTGLSLCQAQQQPTASNSYSASFSANIPQCGILQDGQYFCFANHPVTIGYLDARDSVIRIDGSPVAPKTSCPKRIGCPAKATDTQFNTTLAPPYSQTSPSSTGGVFMNSDLLQTLYVLRDGLLSYATPQFPHLVPPGAYAKLFNFRPATVGSCLNCDIAFQFNYTDFYSCKDPVRGQANLTYAATPYNAAKLKGCTQFFALPQHFCLPQLNNEVCGSNTYEYN